MDGRNTATLSRPAPSLRGVSLDGSARQSILVATARFAHLTVSTKRETVQPRREAPARRSQVARYARNFFIALFALAFAIAAVAAPTDENQVIVPGASAAKADATAPAGTPLSGTFTFVAVLLLAGAGGWLVWRGRAGKFATLNRTSRNLAIEETRSLGNRQFLVVATYQDKKFLLGVCPGKIDLLAPLHEGAAPVPAKERA